MVAHNSKLAAFSLDHHVGAEQERLRDFEAERLGGLQVGSLAPCAARAVALLFGQDLPHHRAPQILLRPDEGGGFFGREWTDIGSKCLESLLHIVLLGYLE